MVYRIGVDVGGTKVAAAIVDSNGKIIDHVRRPSPQASSDALQATIIDCINALSGYNIASIGIGAAGYISADRSTVIYGTNLPWRNEPLGERIAQATGLPVVVENDANSAAWAEYRFGTAQGSVSPLVVTIGTGVGGGIIIDGKLLRGTFGFGGEIGHIHMDDAGPLCGCGQHGCWEVCGSGSALVRFARERANAYPEKAHRLRELSGGGEIQGLAVTQAAQEGDPLALNVFAELGHWNARGIASMITLFDPDVIVLSGGVCEAGSLVIDPINRELSSLLPAGSYRGVPPIRVASLGNNAGIIGAADLSLSA
ncbi:ROK family glucokinase [Actinotignum urinale]|uniref:Glucokinase n=1 Tax=Actinotignum urinale TaxID=190146 RepID=A0AAW9HTW2_9ACTO|nr:ROK family glucokinase [Actinotignum urinale]MDY5155079.1 ROK family glucokinase [Actinotignum urinale]